MGRGRVRVVIADDSLVSREMLFQILDSDPDIEVVGQAKNGAEAVDMVERLRPTLVTMDIHMPNLNGLEATERIMAFSPTPILVVSSSVHGEGMGLAFDALRLGALEVIKKPEVSDWAELDRIGREVIRTVKILANVRVVTHVSGRRHRPKTIEPATDDAGPTRRSIVAIGSSTGGPSALLEVLGRLPSDLSVPVVVAQHIADGFVPGLVSWLDSGCAIHVAQAAPGVAIEPGVAYIAPTDRNILVDGSVLRAREPAAEQLCVPSADRLFESVAGAYGKHAIGVILTGMGADGAQGLKLMHDKGAATIAQDEASCVVFGMPKTAIEQGAAGEVQPITKIAAAIDRLLAE